MSFEAPASASRISNDRNLCLQKPSNTGSLLKPFSQGYRHHHKRQPLRIAVRPAKGILKNQYNLPIERASRVGSGCFLQSEEDLDNFRIQSKKGIKRKMLLDSFVVLTRKQQGSVLLFPSDLLSQRWVCVITLSCSLSPILCPPLLSEFMKKPSAALTK